MVAPAVPMAVPPAMRSILSDWAAVRTLANTVPVEVIEYEAAGEQPVDAPDVALLVAVVCSVGLLVVVVAIGGKS